MFKEHYLLSSYVQYKAGLLFVMQKSPCELNNWCVSTSAESGEDLAPGQCILLRPTPTVASSAVGSQVVVLLLLIHCLYDFCVWSRCLSMAGPTMAQRGGGGGSLALTVCELSELSALSFVLSQFVNLFGRFPVMIQYIS